MSIVDSDVQLMKPREAAEFLRVSLQTLYGWTSARSIPFLKPSPKVLLFDKRELVDWLREKRSAAS